jgi:uncharacterized protein YlxW (UPF0749 family)
MEHTLPAPRSHWRPDRRTLTWTALLLALGVTLALPVGMRERARPVTREAEREPAVQSITRLEEEQRQLKERIAALREQLAAAQRRQANERAALRDIEDALKQQRALAGLTRLAGPGITVLLNDSAAPAPAGAAASDYIIHDTDVRDVVNALWAAGAEAIAINGERLVATSSIVCVGTVIIINDTRLSPPYQVMAVGPAPRLTAAIDTAPQLAPLRRRARDTGVQVKTAAADRLELPAYRGSLAQPRGGLS